MKNLKWLLLLTALFLTSAAQAQFRLGVKGGVNVSSVKFSGDVFDTENVTGFHIGPMVEFMVPMTGFGVDGAVLYSQKGFENGDKSFKNDYIDVPVNLKYKFSIPMFRPYLAAGPFASFRVSGDKFWEIPGDVFDNAKTKNFAAGLNFSAGVEVMDIVQVGVTYSWGLTENYSLYKDEEAKYSGKPHTWMISAAVFF